MAVAFTVKGHWESYGLKWFVEKTLIISLNNKELALRKMGNKNTWETCVWVYGVTLVFKWFSCRVLMQGCIQRDIAVVEF